MCLSYKRLRASELLEQQYREYTSARKNREASVRQKQRGVSCRAEAHLHALCIVMFAHQVCASLDASSRLSRISKVSPTNCIAHDAMGIPLRRFTHFTHTQHPRNAAFSNKPLTPLSRPHHRLNAGQPPPPPPLRAYLRHRGPVTPLVTHAPHHAPITAPSCLYILYISTRAQHPRCFWQKPVRKQSE